MAEAKVFEFPEYHDVDVVAMALVMTNRGSYHVITLDASSDSQYIVMFLPTEELGGEERDPTLEDVMRGDITSRIVDGGFTLDEALDCIADDIREKGVGDGISRP